MADRAEVVLVVDGDGVDAGELGVLAGRLRDELLDLDVTSVEPVEPDSVPGHAKGLGALAGALAVKLGTLEGLRSVVAAVRGWAARTNRTVEVSIGGDQLKLTGVSSRQQEKIVDAWLARHATGP